MLFLELDRFTYNDEGESPDEFSTCANAECRRTLYVGDEIINHYGSVCCNDIRCLIEVTGSKQEIAGDIN
ncbi:hypothetical protein GCM10023310_68680 [Paenibacillus vulneris]